MILLIGGEKGGTGKSTLATNIAAQLAQNGSDVLLLDADPQGTSSKWIGRRNKKHSNLPTIHCMQKTGDIFDAVKDIANRYQQVIIDAGGRDSEELRTAMLVTRKIYIPIRASQPDLETIINMSKLLKVAKSMNRHLEARAILSIAPTHPFINEVQEASELLHKVEGLTLSESIIRDRKCYRDAMSEGKGVIEMESRKATTEIKLLVEEIYG